PNTHVNMAQSTNDVFPTSVHIATIKLVSRLEKTMISLQSALYEKGIEFDNVIKMGRTHLQDAVPIRLGQEFSSYSQVLARDIKRIRNLYRSLLEVNLGATAVGTGLNADINYTEKVTNILRNETGLEFVRAENLVDS